MHLPITHYKRIIQSIFANPNGWENDILVLKNYDFLKSVSSTLMNLFPVQSSLLYRGILLDGNYKNGDYLYAIKERGYISFSTCLNAAKEFSDPDHTLAILLRLQGKTNGFIIRHVPRKSEILFHHTWGKKLNLYDGFFKEFENQEEVILFNDSPKFTLGPINE